MMGNKKRIGRNEGVDVPFVFPKEGTKQMKISSDPRRDSWLPSSTVFTHVLKPSEMGLGMGRRTALHGSFCFEHRWLNLSLGIQRGDSA